MRFYFSLAIMILLTACGFKPIYSENFESESNCSLSEIRIVHLKSEQSYKLRNYLEDELDPNGFNTEKLFDLAIDVTDSISSLLVQKDGTITTKQHNITANYNLKEILSGKIIDQGVIRFSVSFSELPSEYATYALEKKTYDNSLQELASTIKKRLIIALVKYQKTLKHENKLS
jgi:LPS-assembly lipoprotein